MTKSGMNLQDSFLNQVRKENTEIMLMLLDGTRLNGFVRGFDNFTVIMSVRGSQHLIYKHAIAQIVSRRPQGHGEGEREGGHAHAPQAEGAPGAAPGESAPEPVAGAPAQEAPPRREYVPRERREERREGEPRREGEGRERTREERREDRNRDEKRDDPSRPKFNTIDFSSIKIDQEKK